MSFFGGGVDKATKRYNAAKRDYKMWQIEQNRDLIESARGFADMTVADDLAYDTILGQYLNVASNPYIQQVAQQNAQTVQDAYNKGYIPQAMSSFANSGRYGSGLFQRTMADMQSQMNQDVAEANNNLYYQNYANERAMQENARARAASQYDPLNRYSAYQGMLNAFNPGEPTPTTNRGTFLGSVVQGSMSGLVSGDPKQALMGGLMGGIGYVGT